MPTDYAQKLANAKPKIKDKGMIMTFVKRTEDTSQMPTPGGGYPVIETRTEFYGVRRSPKLEEVQKGIFSGENVIVLMPGDACNGRPDNTDYLVFLGKRWDIIKIDPVSPAELDIVYKVAVKESGAA